MSQLTVEEYLESIGALEEQGSPAGTTSIAQSMGVSAASVSEMLRRLAKKGLVEYTPYGGTRLTREGRDFLAEMNRGEERLMAFLSEGIPLEEMKVALGVMSALKSKLDSEEWRALLES